MNFIYNVDSGKVIDFDVRLETEEDLEREIQKTTQAVTEIQETVKSQRKTAKLLRESIRRGDPVVPKAERTLLHPTAFIGGHLRGSKESLRDMEETLRTNIQWLKDHERILESLLTLKRSRFG